MDYIRSFAGITLDLLGYAILARVLFSWMGPKHRQNQIYRAIVDVTDPILDVIKKVVPNAGMLDFSPLIALIAINLIKGLLFI